jgi:hypothetical protein
MSLTKLIPSKAEIEEAVKKHYGADCEAFFRRNTDKLLVNWLPYLHTLFEDIEKTYSEAIVKKFAMVWEKAGKEFMAAPAAGNRNYHGACPFGLVVHSVEVYRLSKQLAKSIREFKPANGREVELDDEEILFCSMFHDLGKSGDGEGGNYYYFEKSDWHRTNMGRMYKFDNPNYLLSHAEMSIYRLNKLIDLNMTMYQAIRFHDGQYVKANETAAHKEKPLTLLLHQADYWAAHTFQE